MIDRPARYDIVIYKGTTFKREFTWQDVTLTRWKARVVAKQRLSDETAYFALSTDDFFLSTDDKILSISGSTVTLVLSANATKELPDIVEGNWTLELEDPSGNVGLFVRGRISTSDGAL